MLLIVFLFFVKIEILSCIFENKNEQDLFDEINREGKNNIQIHLTLQLAAQKRCANEEQLIQSYHKMISNTYRNTDWPREEQLNKIFPDGKNEFNQIFYLAIFLVSERIYLNGLDIRNDIFDNSLLIPNIYRTNFLYVGIAQYQYKNFSARCILYGSTNNFISNHQRLLRLLYILIGSGLFLLILILCSILNDRRRAKLKQEIIDNQNMIIPKKSTTVFIDKDRRSSPRRAEMNRATMARLGSLIDQRSSAVHSFFQSPK